MANRPVRPVVRRRRLSLACETTTWERTHVSLDSTLDAEESGVDLDAVDLSDREFWARPPAARHAVFDALRRGRPVAFFPGPQMPLIEGGPRHPPLPPPPHPGG